MATNLWLGGAVPVAQVENITIGGTPTIADTVTVTINGKAVTYTVTSTDTGASTPVNSVAQNFAALLTAQAGVIPEFGEVVWTATGSSAIITATAATAGVPFIYSTSETGGHTTISGANVTPSAGPNDASTVSNWSTGAVPTTGDSVLIPGSSDILYGLNSLTTAVYNSLVVKAAFTGNVGLAYTSPGGYIEYRTRFFPVGSAVPISIGQGDGTGPIRCNLNVSTTLNLTIYTTGARQVATVPVVNIINASGGTFSMDSGDLGFAADSDTTSVTVASGSVDSGTVTIGANGTVTTMTNDGATVNCYGVITTLNSNGGTTTLYGNPTTITANAGTVNWLGAGTVATATFQGQGPGATAPTLNCSLSPAPRTITNGSFTGGAPFNDPQKTVTMSNAFTFDAASLAASNFGERFSILRS